MKKSILFLSLIGLLSFNLYAQSITDAIRVSSGLAIYNHETTYDFGSVTTGEYRDVTFTITNRSEKSQVNFLSVQIQGEKLQSNFVVLTQPPASLKPGQSGNFMVRFSPSAVGVQSATMYINNSFQPNPYVIYLTGEGVDGPSDDLLVYQEEVLIPNGTGEYDFGVVTNPPVDCVFTLENNLATQIIIESISITQFAAVFSTHNVPQLVPGKSLEEFTIRFDPDTNGNYNGTVTITYFIDKVTQGIYSFTVRGTGDELDYPDIELEKKSDFIDGREPLIPDGGTWDLGTVSLYSTNLVTDFLIKSTGNMPLELIGNNPPVVISGTDAGEFNLLTQQFPTSLLPGEDFLTEVRFNPASLGGKTADVAVYNDSRDHSPTYTFTYTANVVAAVLRLQQGGTTIPHNGSYSYGSVPAGTTKEVTFTIYNDGNINLLFSGAPQIVSGTGKDEFWVTQNPPGTITPGNSGTFKIAFSPLGGGVRTASVHLNNNGSPNPYSFSVTGRSGYTTVSYNFGYRGWYLISLPVVPANPAIQDIFAAVTPYAGLIYDPGTGSYTIISEVNASNAGTGFWIFVETPDAVDVTGTPVFSFDKSLSAGWHTCGSTIMDCQLSASSANNFAGSYFPVYEYDGSGQPYYDIAAAVNQTMGYWAHAYQACTLSGEAVYPPSALSKPSPEQTAILSASSLTPPDPPDLSLLTSAVNSETPLPKKFQVFQNFPNPFNPVTKIRYQIAEISNVTIVVYNTRGERVRTLTDRSHQPGYYSIQWDGRDDRGTPAAAGVYLVRFQAGQKQKNLKVVYVK